jgi:ABC-type Mn2+/Zn2+ transport system ATPase subunit
MTATRDYLLKEPNLNVKLQNQTILGNVSFNVKKGTTLTILGPNGTGKSVLPRAVLNSLPHTGSVEWTEKVKISYVPKNVAVSDFPLSVKEFLAIGRSGINAENVLRLVRLNGKSVLNRRLNV